MSLTYDQIMNELMDYRVLDEQLCCNGQECGCYGVTLREEIAHRLVHAQSQEPEWEEALAECHTYNRMGGLDDAVIADIAHDHQVDPKELKHRFWEE